MASLYEAVMSHTPDTWVETYNDTADVECFVLNENLEEYARVTSKLCGIKPTSVRRVQNAYLWGCYLLRRDEYSNRRGGEVEERELWHATSADKVDYILCSNFDWRRTKRSMFGKGVSFSPDPHYADKYCNDKNGPNRALILCNVLIGNACKGWKGMAIPDPQYDTSIAKNKKVFVKYMDHEFYPAYVAYYNHTTDNTTTL